MPHSRREELLAITLAAAVTLQGVGLVLMEQTSFSTVGQWLLCVAALALLFHQAWRHRYRFNHRVDMILVMLAFGGLGMLAGWGLDLHLLAQKEHAAAHAMAHVHHAHSMDATQLAHPPAAQAHRHGDLSFASILDATFSWMTLLMLVGAIPPSVLFTRCAVLARADRRRWLATHVVGNVGMVVGMIILGHVLARSIGASLGSAIAGGHLAMLIGMVAGMEISAFAAETLFGLKPWRPVAVPPREASPKPWP